MTAEPITEADLQSAWDEIASSLVPEGPPAGALTLKELEAALKCGLTTAQIKAEQLLAEGKIKTGKFRIGGTLKRYYWPAA